MAGDSPRDAKLSLKIETDEALRKMKEVENQAAKTRSAAESATATIGRYGPEELSRPESKANIRRARGVDRVHDAAMARVDEYRLNRHYEGIRQSRAASEAWWGTDAQISQASQGGGRPGVSLGGMAGRFGLGLAAAGIANKAVEGGANYFSRMQNSDLTLAQKVNATIGPLISGLQALQSAVHGTAEAMRRTALRMETDNATRPAAIGVSIDRMNAQLETYGSRRMQEAMRGEFAAPVGYSQAGPSPIINQYDRSTVGGEIGYGEELQRTASGDQAREARRRAIAARNSVIDARQAERTVEPAYNAAGRRMSLADSRYRQLTAAENRTGVRNQASRQAALADLNEANIDFERLAEERIRAIQRVRDATVTASQAESQARQSVISQMQTELQIGESRQARLIGAAERFGAMNPLQQELSANALRHYAAHGPRGSTPDIIGLASQLNPDLVRMGQRNAAEANPLFQQLRGNNLLAEGTVGSITDNQRQNEQLRQSIREQTLANQSRLADESAEAMTSTLERLMLAFRDRLLAIEKKLFVSQQSQFNQANQGGG
jgi:hypothetical protein